MCGIFGYVGSVPSNPFILRTLALLNDTRGGTNCGFYVVTETKGPSRFLGRADEATFGQWLAKRPFPASAKGQYTFIGHSRKSSVGSDAIKNAHPHRVGNLIGVHNGTITNWRDLLKKYESRLNLLMTKVLVTPAVLAEDGFTIQTPAVYEDMVETEEEKIARLNSIESDSLALFTLLESGITEVLTEYVGSAALVWTYKDNSDTVFAWRGQHKTYANGPWVDERPLHCSMTNKGIYISSDDAHLSFTQQIFDGAFKEGPYTFGANQITTIVRGRIVSTQAIERGYVSSFSQTTSYTRTSNFGRVGSRDEYWENFDTQRRIYGYGGYEEESGPQENFTPPSPKKNNENSVEKSGVVKNGEEVECLESKAAARFWKKFNTDSFWTRFMQNLSYYPAHGDAVYIEQGLYMCKGARLHSVGDTEIKELYLGAGTTLVNGGLPAPILYQKKGGRYYTTSSQPLRTISFAENELADSGKTLIPIWAYQGVLFDSKEALQKLNGMLLKPTGKTTSPTLSEIRAVVDAHAIIPVIGAYLLILKKSDHKITAARNLFSAPKAVTSLLKGLYTGVFTYPGFFQTKAYFLAGKMVDYCGPRVNSTPAECINCGTVSNNCVLCGGCDDFIEDVVGAYVADLAKLTPATVETKQTQCGYNETRKVFVLDCKCGNSTHYTGLEIARAFFDLEMPNPRTCKNCGESFDIPVLLAGQHAEKYLPNLLKKGYLETT